MQLAFLTKNPVDPAIVDAAERVLSGRLVPRSVPPAFRALVDCQIFAYCKLSDNDIMRLANAALSNPRGSPSITSQIAIYLAQYQIDKMGDGDGTMLTIRNALGRDPTSAALHLTAGRVLRVLRDFDEAARHLELATGYDSVGTYRTAIGEEWQKLKRDREKARE